ncbi:MAG: hypothetical protein RLZZ59_531, partial [Pseudomonadota bacterium]
MLKYIALIIFSATTSLAADSSVFDVLQSQDQERYTTSDTKEFDVNEGEENNVDISTIQNVQIDQRPTIQNFESGNFHNFAEIVALNKVTSKSKKISIKIGHSAFFGNIEISVKKCWSNGDLYKPLNYIAIEVIENKIDEDAQKIFSGWVISN